MWGEGWSHVGCVVYGEGAKVHQPKITELCKLAISVHNSEGGGGVPPRGGGGSLLAPTTIHRAEGLG